MGSHVSTPSIHSEQTPSPDDELPPSIPTSSPITPQPHCFGPPLAFRHDEGALESEPFYATEYASPDLLAFWSSFANRYQRNQSVSTLQALVNLRRSTLQVSRVESTNPSSTKISDDQPSHTLEFVFDALVPCIVTVYWISHETRKDGFVSYTQKSPSFSSPTSRNYPASFAHVHRLPFIPSQYPLKDLTSIPKLHPDNGSEYYWPLVIVIEALHGHSPQQTQSTFVTFATTSENIYEAKVVRQNLQINTQTYTLHEVYGLPEYTQPSSPTSITAPPTSRECVICLTDPKAALLLPCRHLCLCISCADRLRCRRGESKCPICRGAFEAIVVVKIEQQV